MAEAIAISIACSIAASFLEKGLVKVWNKIKGPRPSSIDRLKSELKTILNELSQKDLRCSIYHYKEGVAYLDEITSISNKVQDVVDSVEQWTRIVQDLLAAAQKSFVKANDKAYEAFSGTSLTLEELILATRIRIAAKIVETFDKPRVASIACKQHLEQLHELPRVQERFSNIQFDDMEQHEDIKQSIVLINSQVYYFIKKFDNLSENLFTWLKINNQNPLIMGVEQGMLSVTEDIPDGYIVRGVDSKSELILQSRLGNEIFKGNERERAFFTFPEEDTTATNFRIVCLSSDENDTMYVITSYTDDISNRINYKLWFIDANANNNGREVALGFSSDRNEIDACIAVNREYIIIAPKSQHKEVYIYGKAGEFQSSFLINNKAVGLAISRESDIIVIQSEVIQVFDITDRQPRNEIDGNRWFPNSSIVDAGFCFKSETIFWACGRTELPLRYSLISCSKNSNREDIQTIFPSPPSSAWRIFTHPKGINTLVNTEEKCRIIF